MQFSDNIKKGIILSQTNEITEFTAYKKLVEWSKNPADKKLLKNLQLKEMEHYNFWKRYSGIDVKEDRKKAIFYFLLAKYLGINFGIQFMENDKKHSKSFEKELERNGNLEILKIIKKEEENERSSLTLIDKSELAYTSSIILGLNDALVELTGALAGFTLAFQNQHTIAVAGLIVGIAASFSMAASEYLSKKEEGGKDCLRASIYTGITYLLTVIFLVTPFFIFRHPFISMVITLTTAVTLICLFNFYISVAKRLPFKKRAGEMILISLSVALFNFVAGYLAKKFLSIEI